MKDEKGIEYTEENLIQGIISHINITNIPDYPDGRTDDNPISEGGDTGIYNLVDENGNIISVSAYNIGNIKAGQFTGKSWSEKMKMCGLRSDKMSPSDVKRAGLLQTLKLPHNAGTVTVNKAIVEDLKAIVNDVAEKCPWFDFKVSSSWRANNSVSSGVSRHCLGVAVDINAGSAGNPWFNVGSNYKGYPSFNQWRDGAKPKWTMKVSPYNGTYKKSKCIWSWDHPVVQIFKAHGWGWGGSYGDVMHFSLADGR